MSPHHPRPAKIMQHAEGLGAPNADQVRQRAMELALIAGRHEATEEDWRQAKRELHGGRERVGSNDEAEMVALVSEHDMVVTDVGHHVENVGLEDSDNIVEELIAEGMDEAVHEQMLAARREDALEEADEDEGEDEEKG
jgi:hypothetical protein